MKIADSIKYGMLLIATILARLPQIFPNVEPVMATTLPAAKKYGAFAGFGFALIAVASFDFVSGRIGLWTIYTALAYGAIGLAAGKWFARFKKVGVKKFVGFSVVATIFYDAVTATLFGFQFGQPLALTYIAQVPFTVYHLIGNTVLVAVFSPLISKYFLETEFPELDAVKTKRASPQILWRKGD